VSLRLQCHACRHFEWGVIDADRCAAFPDGIPDAIWLGEADHAEAFPGDGGIRRAARTAEERADVVQLRHSAHWTRDVERVAHDADPFGALVLAVEASPFARFPDAAALGHAWSRSEDAVAALFVLFRAGRIGAIATGVRLTIEQLELEGCDYLDDKGWLAVGLRLATCVDESALANVPAAWSALATPFGSPYLTARVQQILLRALRRVLPEPPAAAEWVEAPAASALGRLRDGPVAFRFAAGRRIGIDDVHLLEPWTRVTSAKELEEELARELVPGHRLHGRRGLRAVARRSDGDEVLFEGETLAAVVRLTWAKEVDPRWPATDIFPSVEEWATRRMRPDHVAFSAREPRAIAFAFRSAVALSSMAARLPDAARWDWTVRDSPWYGDYLWGKDGPLRVRVFAAEEPGRFTLQIDVVGVEPAAGFDAEARHLGGELLAALEADSVEPAAPEQD